jgi:hypothetical protein
MAREVTADDVALHVLTQVRQEQHAPVSEALLKEIYTLLRRYQFEADRDKAIVGVKAAVEAEIDRLIQLEADT